jgi:2-oxoglutarate dehydrogenase E2 component (dihydrolipoamide succinyltransferase)
VIGRIAESAAVEGASLFAAPAVAAQPTPAAAPEPVSQAVLSEAGNGRAAASATPVARIAAEAANVDLTQIPGTGPRGKVTKGDVQSFLAADTRPPAAYEPSPTAPAPPVAAPAQPVAVPTPAAPPAPQPPIPFAPTPAPPISGLAERREERVRMSRRRKTIADRLVLAQQTAAMLTTFNEVDMSGIQELRKRRKDSFKERHGVSLGFMSFFVKAAIGALKEFPMLNAEIDGDTILVKHYYDIGIAVGTEQGLLVPVVRDADRKTFAEIEREIGDLATRGRAGTLALAELQGGTFTISNGGTYGSLMSTPILNFPQVGILGMHKIEERPVVVNGEIAIRPMMYLAFSYDHRIVDGTDAVRFLVKIKQLIEDPESLLLEG